jgi:flagellar protein FliS
MRNHGYQNYFDNEVLAASPLKLIHMLYSALLESIAAARRHVRHQDIRARNQAINKAIGIVAELSQCLNHEAGGALSRKLAGVYGYVIRLLIQANLQQIEAPLAEAESLLSALAEAWVACTPAVPEHSFPSRELIPPVAFSGDSSFSTDSSQVAP